MHEALFFTLLSVFILYQLGFWYLFVSLLANLFVFPYYATPCNGGAEALKQPARIGHDKFRTLSALASAFAVFHHSVFWYTFTSGDFVAEQATGHPHYPVWLTTLLVLSLGISHLLLLILLHSRLVSIFADTDWRISPRRQRSYLLAIILHFILELSSIFLSQRNRYVVWVVYDLLLCALCSAFTVEFTRRLFKVIGQIQWHIERAIVAQRQAIHERIHCNVLSMNNGLTNDVRSTIHSENELNVKQLRLYELISKMTVLTVLVCFSAIIWTIGPIMRMSMEVENHTMHDRWLLVTEMLLHWNVAFSVQMFIYFSFAFSERRYRMLFGQCCDTAVLRCLVPDEQSAFLDSFLKMSVRERRTLLTIAETPADSYVQLQDHE